MVIYKRKLRSEEDFKLFKRVLTYNYDNSKRPSPIEYPCCVVYSDEGGPWGEYWEFVYPSDLYPMLQ